MLSWLACVCGGTEQHAAAGLKYVLHSSAIASTSLLSTAVHYNKTVDNHNAGTCVTVLAAGGLQAKGCLLPHSTAHSLLRDSVLSPALPCDCSPHVETQT
jgi:hypothetical protein